MANEWPQGPWYEGTCKGLGMKVLDVKGFKPTGGERMASRALT